MWLVPPYLLGPVWDRKHPSRNLSRCGPLGSSYIPGFALCAPSTSDQLGILQPQGKLLAPIGAEPTQSEEESHIGWFRNTKELYEFGTYSFEGGSCLATWTQPKRSSTTWRPLTTWQTGPVLRAL